MVDVAGGAQSNAGLLNLPIRVFYGEPDGDAGELIPSRGRGKAVFVEDVLVEIEPQAIVHERDPHKPLGGLEPVDSGRVKSLAELLGRVNRFGNGRELVQQHGYPGDMVAEDVGTVAALEVVLEALSVVFW